MLRKDRTYRIRQRQIQRLDRKKAAFRRRRLVARMVANEPKRGFGRSKHQDRDPLSRRSMRNLVRWRNKLETGRYSGRPGMKEALAA